MNSIMNDNDTLHSLQQKMNQYFKLKHNTYTLTPSDHTAEQEPTFKERKQTPNQKKEGSTYEIGRDTIPPRNINLESNTPKPSKKSSFHLFPNKKDKLQKNQTNQQTFMRQPTKSYSHKLESHSKQCPYSQQQQYVNSHDKYSNSYKKQSENLECKQCIHFYCKKCGNQVNKQHFNSHSKYQIKNGYEYKQSSQQQDYTFIPKGNSVEGMVNDLQSLEKILVDKLKLKEQIKSQLQNELKNQKQQKLHLYKLNLKLQNQLKQIEKNIQEDNYLEIEQLNKKLKLLKSDIQKKKHFRKQLREEQILLKQQYKTILKHRKGYVEQEIKKAEEKRKHCLPKKGVERKIDKRQLQEQLILRELVLEIKNLKDIVHKRMSTSKSGRKL